MTIILAASAWTLGFLFIISCIISAILFTFWLVNIIRGRRLDNEVKQISQRFLITNLLCVGLFTLSVQIIGIHAIRALVISLNKSTNHQDFYNRFVFAFNFPNDNFDLIGASCIYVIDKHLLYYILYIRLKTLLDGSMFEYDKKIYFKVLIMILISFISISSAYVLVFINRAVSHIFVFMYLCFDISIPIYLNFLFIKKLKEINKFLNSSFRMNDSSMNIYNNDNDENGTTIGSTITSTSASPHAWSSSQCNNNNNNRKQQAVSMPSGTLTPTEGIPVTVDVVSLSPAESQRSQTLPECDECEFSVELQHVTHQVTQQVPIATKPISPTQSDESGAEQPEGAVCDEPDVLDGMSERESEQGQEQGGQEQGPGQRKEKIIVKVKGERQKENVSVRNATIAAAIAHNVEARAKKRAIEKKEQGQVLFETMKRSSALAFIIAISSLFVLIYMALKWVIVYIVNNGNQIYITLAIQYLCLSFDSLINICCLILYFNFSKYWTRFCHCCNLSNCVINKCLNINSWIQS